MVFYEFSQPRLTLLDYKYILNGYNIIHGIVIYKFDFIIKCKSGDWNVK